MQFVRSYPETGWFALALFGLFLLVVSPGVRREIVLLVGQLARRLSGAIAGIGDRVVRQAYQVSVADAIGLGLLLVALAALVYRLRWRLMHSPDLTATVCPRCHQVLHRVHRHRLDRIISWLVEVRRYRCADPVCRWEGRRVVGPDGSPSPSGRR